MAASTTIAALFFFNKTRAFPSALCFSEKTPCVKLFGIEFCETENNIDGKMSKGEEEEREKKE